MSILLSEAPEPKAMIKVAPSISEVHNIVHIMTLLRNPRSGEELLLMFRRKPEDTFGGMLNCPSGHIDGSETRRAAAVREFIEETGIERSMKFRHLGEMSVQTNIGTFNSHSLIARITAEEYGAIRNTEHIPGSKMAIALSGICVSTLSEMTPVDAAIIRAALARGADKISAMV